MRGTWRVAVVVVALAPVLTAGARPAPRGTVLDELFPSQAVARGVTHREFSTTAPAGRVNDPSDPVPAPGAQRHRRLGRLTDVWAG